MIRASGRMGQSGASGTCRVPAPVPKHTLYVYAYIYIHVYIYIHIYTYIYIHVFTYIYIHVCIYIYIHIVYVLFIYLCAHPPPWTYLCQFLVPSSADFRQFGVTELQISRTPDFQNPNIWSSRDGALQIRSSSDLKRNFSRRLQI